MYAKASASASVAVHLHSQKSGEGPRLYRKPDHADLELLQPQRQFQCVFAASSTIDVTMRRCHAVVAVLQSIIEEKDFC
jgi:hypothetical protein